MSSSALATVVKLSPNCSARTAKIDTITIHHMAANLSVEVCGAGFASKDRKASSNYGVGTDGRIGLYVPEDKRAWTSSNWRNDDRAVTIEVANDGKGPDWHVSDAALEATIELCVDICRRNGIQRLNFTGDTTGNLTMHKWFSATGCPGPYLGGKFPYIADEVNRRLGVAEEESQGDKRYWVRSGPYGSRGEAEACRDALKADGYVSEIQEEDKPAGAVPEPTPEPVPKPTPEKSVERVAQEVLWGLWGNGAERKQRLEKAGYDYQEVQGLVDQIKGRK